MPLRIRHVPPPMRKRFPHVRFSPSSSSSSSSSSESEPEPVEEPEPELPPLTEKETSQIVEFIAKVRERLKCAEDRLADSMHAFDLGDENCVVCLEPLNSEERERTSFSCATISHLHCAKCTRRMTRCGVCRASECSPHDVRNPAKSAVAFDRERVDLLKSTLEFALDPENDRDVLAASIWRETRLEESAAKRKFEEAKANTKRARATVTSSRLVDSFLF